MKLPSLQRRTLLLIGVGAVTAALFGYVVLRSGPLAPVSVTTAVVEARSISPALFGIGTVEARFSYKIGPTSAGRIGRILVDVGDQVRSGQTLAEMDPVDLDARIAGGQHDVQPIIDDEHDALRCAGPRDGFGRFRRVGSQGLPPGLPQRLLQSRL